MKLQASSPDTRLQLNSWAKQWILLIFSTIPANNPASKEQKFPSALMLKTSVSLKMDPRAVLNELAPDISISSLPVKS